MDNLLSSKNRTETRCELIEADYSCWVLRANQANEDVQKYFTQQNISLPTPTQLIDIVQDDGEITTLGISVDESWWLASDDTSPILSQIQNAVHEYNGNHNSTLAFIEQSAAYKNYQLKGEGSFATQLLTHLIPYDWLGLQAQLETLSKEIPPQGKVIATVMQSVPIVVYSAFPHQYKLLIRRSFSDFAIRLIQHTANLIQ